MPRDKDIRSRIGPLLDELLTLYETTDPRLPENPEYDRLQCAQRAFDVYWQLYGELMIWAQNQIVGYYHASDDVDAAILVQQISESGLVHRDSPELEFLGAFETARAPYNDREIESKFEYLADHLNDSIQASALRRAFIMMLMSEDAGSSVLRDRLRYALNCVEHGQVAKLFEADTKGRRGKPFDLDRTKSIVIMHLSYLEAKGFKTHKALELIGEEIAASAETIRSWKKKLACNEWFSFTWDASRLAAEHEQLMLSDVDDGSDEGALSHVSEYYGPHNNITIAMDFLRYKDTSLSLSSLKEDLNRFRR
jgi:hypothetical protein